MATRSATKPWLGRLQARPATAEGTQKPTGGLKTAVERWENEGGAQDAARLRNEGGALVDQELP